MTIKTTTTTTTVNNEAMLRIVERRSALEAAAVVAADLAQRVVDKRAALKAAKDAADEAERLFRVMGCGEVILEDGTKVAIVEQSRRSVDTLILKDIIPTGQFQRVTRRTADLKAIDAAIAAGWLDATTVTPAISVAEVSSVKVTKPKR